MNILAMFPGQGSQFVGMGRDLVDNFPIARQTFEEASDAASLDILKLCLDGPEDDLRLTANTQPCILAVSIASWRVLKREAPIKPTAFAGHSLGEYSAVVAAEKLDFARACVLVRRRGQAMQEAVPEGVGAMAAVMNISSESLQEFCDKYTNANRSVEIVNYNSPQQLVIAGHKESVQAVCADLETDGVRFVVLPVSAPFHSRLMLKAREVMEPLLKDSEFKSSSAKIIANLSGEVADDYQADYLIKQIDSPVKWTQTLTTAQEILHCDSYIEIGPGRVLSGLAKRSIPKGQELLNSTDMPKLIERFRKI